MSGPAETVGAGRIRHLLIANRGEIAVRVARTAADLGIRTTAVYAADDADSLHTRVADTAIALGGRGVAAYLDGKQFPIIALKAGCEAIHPGYGFLSENAAFARRCLKAGLIFVGPRPETLDLFGDKSKARAFADRCGVPVLPGSVGATSLADAEAFFAALGPGAAVILKACAGGGGRGIRVVQRAVDLPEAYARAASEAQSAFGSGDLYVERFLPQARHIEVQIAGDGRSVIQLGERDCTLQRRQQKVIEIAPAPALAPALREQILEAAARMAAESRYLNVGTFEFLYDTTANPPAFYFLEANPRLQVEHTVTEEVTGLDLVRLQLELAGGRTLTELGLAEGIPAPRGYAIQMRVNMETLDNRGQVRPAGGTLRVYEPPSGPGIRVDGYGYAGYTPNPAFDSLLAKVIVHSRAPRYAEAVAKAYRALAEFRVAGVATNIPFLLNLLRRPEVAAHAVHTRFIETHAAVLTMTTEHREPFFPPAATVAPEAPPAAPLHVPPGMVAVTAPLAGRVVSVDVAGGDAVTAGQQVAVIEAMKMEHLVVAEHHGTVQRVFVAPGEVVNAGAVLLMLDEARAGTGMETVDFNRDLNAIRPDLAEVIARHAAGLDEQRPDAVARRAQTGQRTARANIADLCDPGSFVEYGALALAAQRRRRSLDDLIHSTPADGLITGIGTVNAGLFGPEPARCAVLAYDYTVLAGTQGMMNHKKLDRMLELAATWRLPVVLFGEGGGGRPGDTDALAVAGLDLPSFARYAALSGQVPLVSIVAGRCFAGNAALVGCSDVIIATANASIGMGGPAMIEGGGLGVVAAEAVGPMDVQTRNGVVDLVVPDEATAVGVARQYLAYFQGTLPQWQATDARLLRGLIPENRRRVYDIRTVIAALADVGSVLELRRPFGPGIITALIRVEGRPLGLIANDPAHLSGAIEADGADKAARFMRLCDSYGLPILSLCDTPGFMVGPDVERRAQVRHVSRMFVTGASVRVPWFTVVLRKGYGLGAMAMAGGGFHAAAFTVAWPTGEFGAMGLEGAVRLGYRRELEAVADPQAREALFQKLVAEAYDNGKALNVASYFEIDAVIDPADTRRWLLRGLQSLPARPADPASRPPIDPW